MNTSKLNEGMVVKNYKEMCTLLDEPYYKAAGRAKDNQIEQWERYFDYERVGHNWIIKTIYNEPLPDASKIRSIYTGLIELRIMEFLEKSIGSELFISKTKLYQMLGMASCKYFEFRQEYHETHADDICDLYSIQRVDSKLNDILNSALSSMSKRFLIKYQYEDIVHEKMNDGTIIQRRMTTDEAKKVLTINRELLLEYRERLKVPDLNIQGVYNRQMITQFYKEAEKRIKALFPTWDRNYKKLRIIKCNEDIQKAIPIKQDELKKLSQDAKIIELNTRVCEALIKQMDTRKTKYWEKFGWMVINDMVEKLPIPELSETFVEKQKNFIDSYVKINDVKEENAYFGEGAVVTED